MKARRIAPWELDNGEMGHFVADYRRHFLAEGDSWFSFGSFFGNSILDELDFQSRVLITQTASPGDTLSHMADWTKDANFARLIDGRLSYAFDAILLSGGGNDLIDAAGAAQQGNGLLRMCTEAASSAADCINEDSWGKFDAHLRFWFGHFSGRVGNSKLNAGAPIFVHTYDYPTPRPAGAGFGKGPWLHPSMQAHNVPPQLWTIVTDELFTRLRTLVTSLGLANVHVVDTAGTLQRAAPETNGASHDWLNEIHPTADGYRKLAMKWTEAIEQELGP